MGDSVRAEGAKQEQSERGLSLLVRGREEISSGPGIRPQPGEALECWASCPKCFSICCALCPSSIPWERGKTDFFH